MTAKLKKCISAFFYETFRPRTAGDYKAIFLKNTDCDQQGDPGSRIPWLYIRVFGFLMTIFAVFVGIPYFVDDFTTGTEAELFAAGVFCFAYLMLVFECVGKGTVNFIVYLSVFFVGGMVALYWPFFVYSFMNDDLVSDSFFITEVTEELSKGLTAIAAILILKKRNSSDGILIGSAVGAGFAFGENLGYLQFITRPINLSYMMFDRSFEDIGTHIFWTALICFAFCKPRKPLADVRFYLGLICSCSLHVLWNLSVGGAVWLQIVGITVCAIAAIIGWSLILKSLNKREDADDPGDKSERQPYPLRHIRGLSLLLTVVLLALCFTGYLAFQKIIPEYYEPDLSSIPISDLLDKMKTDVNLDVDFSRPYDPDGENNWYLWEKGVIVVINQKVAVGDKGYVKYEYRYDEDSGEYNLSDFECYTYADDEDEESGDVCHPWRLVLSKDLAEQNLDFSDLSELEFGKDYILFYYDDFFSDKNPVPLGSIRYIDDGKVYYEDTGNVNGNGILSSACGIVFVSVASAIVLAEAVLFICLSVKIRKKRQTE